jgi:hypothetical protein
VTLFKEEYPAIRYPIDTFCFLVFSLETDFTRKFPTCLQVYESLVWNTFSELHSVKSNYLVFSAKLGTGRMRSEKKQFDSSLHGLLNEAISYEAVKHRFYLRHEVIKKFYFLLCQMRIIRIRRDIGVTNGSYDEATRIKSIPINELLIYARDIQERIWKFRKYEADKILELDQFFQTKKRKRCPPSSNRQEEEKDNNNRIVIEGDKKFKLSSSLGKKKSVSISIVPSEMDEMVEVEEDEEFRQQQQQQTKKTSFLLDEKAYISSNEKMLRIHASKDIPDEYYGLLNENDMLARIYRLEWYLSYCRDGWRDLPEMRFTNSARQDPTLSLWGWRERRVPESEARNSSYFNSYYTSDKKEPFAFYEVVETNEVYHPRYRQ